MTKDLWTYDEDGCLTERSIYKSEDKLWQRYVHEYRDDCELSKTVLYKGNGKIGMALVNVFDHLESKKNRFDAFRIIAENFPDNSNVGVRLAEKLYAFNDGVKRQAAISVLSKTYTDKAEVFEALYPKLRSATPDTNVFFAEIYLEQGSSDKAVSLLEKALAANDSLSAGHLSSGSSIPSSLDGGCRNNQ